MTGTTSSGVAPVTTTFAATKRTIGFGARQGGDTLHGGEHNDQIWGGVGPDTIDGFVGDDDLRGGDGRDIIDGSFGDDRIWGGEHGDTIQGGSGSDYIKGEKGPDTIYAVSQNGFNDFGEPNVIEGNKGHDRLYGGKGNDAIKGNEGNDRIWGRDGNDLLEGNLGNDTIFASTSHSFTQNNHLHDAEDIDAVSGGSGRDSCSGMIVPNLDRQSDGTFDFEPACETVTGWTPPLDTTAGESRFNSYVFQCENALNQNDYSLYCLYAAMVYFDVASFASIRAHFQYTCSALNPVDFDRSVCLASGGTYDAGTAKIVFAALTLPISATAVSVIGITANLAWRLRTLSGLIGPETQPTTVFDNWIASHS